MLKYLLFSLGSFILIYIIYWFLVVKPQVKNVRRLKKGKEIKKVKKNPPEIDLLVGYYKVNIEKVGVIKTFRTLNFVNSLVLTILVMIVFPIKESWLKLVILSVLILPTIWFTYYFLAKYFKYIERKRDNV